MVLGEDLHSNEEMLVGVKIRKGIGECWKAF